MRKCQVPILLLLLRNLGTAIFIACVAVAAATFSGCGGSARGAHTQESPSALEWRALKPLPLSAGDTGDAVVAAGRVTAFSVGGQSRRRAALQAWEWDGENWTRTSRNPLRIDARSRPQALAVGGLPCTTAVVGRTAGVWCVNSGRFRRLGQRLATTSPRTPAWVQSSETESAPPMVLRMTTSAPRPAAGGVGLTATQRVSVMRFDGDRWHRSGQPVEADAKSNVSRAHLALDGNHPCVAYGLPRTTGTVVRTKCLAESGWTKSSPDRISESPGLTDVDGFQVFKGVPFLGTDRFEPGRNVTWNVSKLVAGKWSTSDLATTEPGWNAQGDLEVLDGSLWATQFAQRQTPDGLQAKVTARRTSDPAATSRQVGGPLLDGVLYGPLSLRLLSVAGRVVAFSSLPDRTLRRNRLALYELTPSAT